MLSSQGYKIKKKDLTKEQCQTKENTSQIRTHIIVTSFVLFWFPNSNARTILISL